MAIDNISIIDFIGIDKKTNELILTISDHLDWDNTDTHLEILQAKLNAYLSFIESGEIYEHKKEAMGRKIIIEIVGKYNLPTEVISFYKNVNVQVKDLKVEVRFMPSMQ